MGYSPSGNKKSDTTEHALKQKAILSIFFKITKHKGSLPLFSFKKYYIILALWTRIQHFRDLRRNYVSICPLLLIAFHQKHKFVHILMVIFHFFLMLLHTYMWTCQYIHMEESFSLEDI